METTTAGISPGLAGTCSVGTGRPTTRSTAATSSSTLIDRPAPMISGPVCPARHATSSPATTSRTCTKSRRCWPLP